jgi:hypothetical protein
MILAIILALAWQGQPAVRAGTATLRGKIVSEDRGAPVKYAAVEARGTATGRGARTVTADDSGVFEVRDLEPGAYVVRASKAGFLTREYRRNDDDAREIKLSAGQVEELTIRLTRAGVISGTISDAYGDPVAGASVQAFNKVYRQGRPELTFRFATQTDDRGEYRFHDLTAGRYYVRAGRLGPTPQSSPLAMSLFSGASRLEDAQPIRVKAGEERAGINLTLQEAVLFDVTGRVVSLESGLGLANVPLNLVAAGMGPAASGSTGADGSFRLREVSAGAYVLNAYVPPPGEPRSAPYTINRLLDLNVGNATGLIVRAGPGVAVKGKVVTNGGDLPAHLAILFSPRNPGAGANTHLTVDGSFECTHVQPGLYDVVLLGESGSRFLTQSVVAGGNNVTDSGLEVGESGTPDVTVTLDLHPAAISGKLLDAAGKPLPFGAVALIAADPKKRLMTRYFRTTVSGRDGTFKLPGVPPGDYLMVIWPGEDPGQVLDSEVFAMIEKLATPVKLERGHELSQDLRLTEELRTVADAFAQ